MIAQIAALCRYIADALDPPLRPVEAHPDERLALARAEYDRACKAHRGQRQTYEKFQAALRDVLRRELGK